MSCDELERLAVCLQQGDTRGGEWESEKELSWHTPRPPVEITCFGLSAESKNRLACVGRA